LEVLELSFVKLKPWFGDEAMIFKWENLSTWVRMKKRENEWKVLLLI
jgi:hypothetical protein